MSKTPLNPPPPPPPPPPTRPPNNPPPTKPPVKGELLDSADLLLRSLQLLVAREFGAAFGQLPAEVFALTRRLHHARLAVREIASAAGVESPARRDLTPITVRRVATPGGPVMPRPVGPPRFDAIPPRPGGPPQPQPQPSGPSVPPGPPPPLWQRLGMRRPRVAGEPIRLGEGPVYDPLIGPSQSP